MKTVLAFGVEPGDPAVGALTRDALGLRSVGYGPPLMTHTLDQQQPAVEVEPSITVGHENLRLERGSRHPHPIPGVLTISRPVCHQRPGRVQLDGGTYTWDSGITQTLSVERVEPWGGSKPDDFCGDGSCGVADPDDTRLVLRYDVSVPSDLAEPFDPYSCPGDLHVTSGNDDEAFSQISGDFDQELGGKILPGLSKFGVNEYYIEKAYAGAEFYIESSCGDTEMSGESVIFQGPVADLG